MLFEGGVGNKGETNLNVVPLRGRSSALSAWRRSAPVRSAAAMHSTTTTTSPMQLSSSRTQSISPNSRLFYNEQNISMNGGGGGNVNILKDVVVGGGRSHLSEPSSSATESLMSSSFPSARFLDINAGNQPLCSKQMSYKNGRSFSNQTISISTLGVPISDDDFFLRTSSSNQDLLRSNDIRHKRHSMIISQRDYKNMIFSNQTFIDPLFGFQQGSAISVGRTAQDFGASSSVGELKKSRHALLPKIPTYSADNLQLATEGRRRNLAGLDAFQLSDDIGNFNEQPMLTRGLSVRGEGFCAPSTNIRSSYLGSNLSKSQRYSRSHSLLTNDKVIDIDYDSDTGWKRKNVSDNLLPLELLNYKSNEVLSSKSPRDKFDVTRRKQIRKRSNSWKNSRPNSVTSRNGSKDRFSNSSKSIDQRMKKELPSDPLKSIINEVRQELLQKPSPSAYLSDESPRQEKYNKPSKLENSPDDNETFPKCRSRTSSGNSIPNIPLSDDGSDDVFETKPRMKRRSSSLEDLPKHPQKDRSHSKSRSSSVSINDTPECFTYSYDTSPNANYPPSKDSSSIANDRNFDSPKNGVNLLQPSPHRGSLKKSSTSKNLADAKPSQSDASKHLQPKKSNTSNEYEARDRRRDGNGNGNGRDMYRRDLSDREQKDTQLDSFNRSLSTNEGTPEDKIGEFKCTKSFQKTK